MKRKDFFDNLNVLFNKSENDEEYAFTQAVIYRDLKTGEIDSIQIVNREYDEFLIVDRNGEISVVNMDEQQDTKKKRK